MLTQDALLVKADVVLLFLKKPVLKELVNYLLLEETLFSSAYFSWTEEGDKCLFLCSVNTVGGRDCCQPRCSWKELSVPLVCLYLGWLKPACCGRHVSVLDTVSGSMTR